MRVSWKVLMALAPVFIGLIAATVLWLVRDNQKLLVVLTQYSAALFAGCTLSLALTVAILLVEYVRLRSLIREAQAKMLQVEAHAQKEIKRAHDEAMAQAATERRQLLGRIEHSIKNPLQVIEAALPILADVKSEQTYNGALESIHRQAKRLNDLTRSSLQLANLPFVQLHYEAIDVHSFVNDIIEPHIAKRSIRLIASQAPLPLAVIYADHDLLHLAIDNLVDNALKYASENDKIEMRAARSVADTLGEIVTIVVADTGRGIPDADMPHVWDAFYRGNNTQGVPGSGMGLPIARAIIERHQGTIELHSPTRGGTEFIIRLPTEQPASQDR